MESECISNRQKPGKENMRKAVKWLLHFLRGGGGLEGVEDKYNLKERTK